MCNFIYHHKFVRVKATIAHFNVISKQYNVFNISLRTPLTCIFIIATTPIYTKYMYILSSPQQNCPST